jgi:hypothetical protein
MTRRDGDVRLIFRQHLPEAQWSSVETGATQGGVPDSECCFEGGAQGWIEFKSVTGWRVTMRPAQIAWISRRVRMGGVVWIAARKENTLYLVHGAHVHRLHDDGLQGATWCYRYTGPWHDHRASSAGAAVDFVATEEQSMSTMHECPACGAEMVHEAAEPDVNIAVRQARRRRG